MFNKKIKDNQLIGRIFFFKKKIKEKPILSIKSVYLPIKKKYFIDKMYRLIKSFRFSLILYVILYFWYLPFVLLTIKTQIHYLWIKDGRYSFFVFLVGSVKWVEPSSRQVIYDDSHAFYSLIILTISTNIKFSIHLQ